MMTPGLVEINPDHVSILSNTTARRSELHVYRRCRWCMTMVRFLCRDTLYDGDSSTLHPLYFFSSSDFSESLLNFGL